MNFFKEIERETEAYMEGLVPFSQLQDGEEFQDLEGNVWEKRSDESAIAWEWEDGYRPVPQEFNPTDMVRKL